jgi:hypothetical protein
LEKVDDLFEKSVRAVMLKKKVKRMMTLKNDLLDTMGLRSKMNGRREVSYSPPKKYISIPKL